jgi:6-pyruvoyltetrahydropterin/6-carboxytetrahydropterin synthase
VEVSASVLDELGMSIDFKNLSHSLEEITGELDHRNLDNVEEFKDKNPTAENLAAFIYRELKLRLSDGISLEQVEVSETDKYSVSYSE